MSEPKETIVLCILDGWGVGDGGPADATAVAATPRFDRLMAERPTATLKTCGPDVGLPEGQMGNSEVGHMNLGAGRVVWMDLPKIDRAIDSGDFAAAGPIAELLRRMDAGGSPGGAPLRGGAVHVAGLCSPGGVHAHHRHIAAAANAFAASGRRTRLHLFTDGRDTPPKSALEALAALKGALDTSLDIRIATVSGRYDAMDRDQRWERTERAFKALYHGEGETAASAEEAIEAAYARGETDEFIRPTVIADYEGAGGEDALFMANFRADRARQLLTSLLDPSFDAFERDGARRWRGFDHALGMVSYSAALDGMMASLFPPERIEDGLGAWIAGLGKTQFRLAETEKYPHVTYFFNGGDEAPHAGEERAMAPSPKVATYDLAPEMSAAEVGDALTKAIDSRAYDLIVVNFANPDMVGHTGDLSAAAKAVEAVDVQLGRAADAIEKAKGAMVVTADHGNCEMMTDPTTGAPHTAHTLNVVPIALLDARAGAPALKLSEGGRLADVAPTLLDLMGAPRPAAMTGRSLLEPE